MVVLAILAVLFSGFMAHRAAEDEKRQMLFALHSRSESLMWAVEGGARLIDGDEPGAISGMLAEIGRQPGIAWIALVDRSGRILYDSYPQLNGDLLYTPGELAFLRPEADIQGRFSPDDPDLFETWKIFQPERLRLKGKKHGIKRASYIFVALDVSEMRKRVEDYVEGLWLISLLAAVSLLSIIALAFYIYSYRSSRRGLEDARTLAMQIVNSYPAAILAADESGRVTFRNEMARRLLRLPDSCKKLHLDDIPFLDWHAMIREMDAGNQVMGREWDLASDDAGSPAISLSGARLTNAAGKMTGYFFVMRDIGEIRLLKKKLAQSRRLSSLGKLASGLAHEIRNPLSSIRGYAHYLEKKFSHDPMGSGTARLLAEETERLDRVLGDLLSLARPARLRLKHVPLSAILRRAALLARPDADSKKIDLRVDLPENPDDIIANVDDDRLLQAVLNILINSIQATQQGGKVTLALDRAPARPAKDGKTVPSWRIRIADNGPGMSEDVLRQIFTPYFTTRASGTGLGLPIAQGIVESHGGVLLVASSPMHGAEFTIILPENYEEQTENPDRG